MLEGMALSPKIQLFVKEYLVDRNATRAAKAAGYSAKSAHAQGCRLLKNAEVQAEIKKHEAAQDTAFKRRAQAQGLTKDRWLRELQRIAFANIDDFVTIEDVEMPQGESGKTYTVTQVRAVATKSRRRSFGAAVKKISETKNGIGIELHSKQSALDTLGKAMGWLKEDAINLNLPQVDSVQVRLTLPANGREAPNALQPPDKKK